MKIKIFSLFIIINILSAAWLCNSCFAGEPTAEREYIARLMKGGADKEERVNVNYKDLEIGEGDYFRVSFLDIDNSVLLEYDIELSVNEPAQSRALFIPGTIQGLEYVYIEYFGSGCSATGIKLPLKN